MVSNFFTLFSSKASIIGLNDGGAKSGSLGSSATPNISFTCAHVMRVVLGFITETVVTGLFGFMFKESGTRNILDSSKTDGSTIRPRSTHKSLRRWASGFHSFLSSVSSRSQYACIPFPEFIRIGTGKPTALQNF